MSRKILLIIIAILAVLISLVVAWLGFVYIKNINQKDSSGNLITENVSAVTFVSSPDVVDLYINDKHYLTPIELNLPKGDYVIAGAKTGYTTYTGSYSIVDNKSHRFEIKLPVDPDTNVDGDGTI